MSDLIRKSPEGFARIPAFVDVHVHFREPGFPDKETIATGALAAAAGGYQAVCMMPNTSPAIDSVRVLDTVDREGRGRGVNIFALAAMTEGQKGSELTDLAAMDAADTRCRELTGHGVCAVSEDGKTLGDYALMEETCRRAKGLGLPVMDHAEPEAETIGRDVALARRTGAHIHIQHVSLAESVRLIREAKAQGAPVSCETAPHYLALTSDALGSLGANAKMNPPLAQERDRAALITALSDGTIDCLATDHAPHEVSAKAGDLSKAANGIIGLETAFPVAYTVLVRGGHITFERLIELMSLAPARLIGLQLSPDTYVDVDVEHEYVIDKNTFRSKGRNTPFHGMPVYGRIMRTVVDGKEIYSSSLLK